jgi:2-keto-4-pentenoate hydratase/2-oxohepta-3-ene-1,7-dioic acid hydratase in catechol pathway
MGVNARKEELYRSKILKKYGIEKLPSIDICELFPDFNETIINYTYLDGTSLPIDIMLKILCTGINYLPHIAEMGRERPEHPVLFVRFADSVVGHGAPLVRPAASVQYDYEGELAVVIGRICRDVAPERVGDVVYGYTVGNDVTARDLQKSDVQFTRAKGFDSFCPLGPWIETELDTSDLRLQTHLNGDLKQDGSTKDMIFDVATLVSHVSAVMTLLPGDVILTGTPEGVGPMNPGDEVDVTISGIGTLTNKVVSRD